MAGICGGLWHLQVGPTPQKNSFWFSAAPRRSWPLEVPESGGKGLPCSSCRLPPETAQYTHRRRDTDAVLAKHVKAQHVHPTCHEALDSMKPKLEAAAAEGPSLTGPPDTPLRSNDMA